MNIQRLTQTHPFALERLCHLRILEIRSKIYAYRGVAKNRESRIIRALEDVDECFALRLAVLEEHYATTRRRLKRLQRFGDMVLILIVEVALKLDQRLLLVVMCK